MRFRLPFVVLAAGLSVVTCSVSVRADDKPVYALPALSAFDGKTWSGLTIGQTTAQVVKDTYKVDKKNLVPWSLRLSTPMNSGYRLNVLFAGRDDKTALLSAILVRYDVGLPLADLRQQLGDGTPLYQGGRLDDWLVYAYPDKGVSEFVSGGVVKAVLLQSPATLAAYPASLGPARTEIVRQVDPHANEPKIMYFGTVTVTTELDGLPFADSDKHDLEEAMRRATAGGAMVFQSYATGSFTTDVNGSYHKDKGGSVTVTCTIQGQCPYGPLTGSGSKQDMLDKGMDNPGPDTYRDAIIEAFRLAQSDFAQKMRAAGPPSPETIRQQAWDAIFQELRQDSTVAATAGVAPVPVPPGSMAP